jgi:hypothetical protein
VFELDAPNSGIKPILSAQKDHFGAEKFSARIILTLVIIYFYVNLNAFLQLH